MSKESIILAWNAQADEFNQWEELSAEEQVDFAIKRLNCNHISCHINRDILASIYEAMAFLPCNGVQAILCAAAQEIQAFRDKEGSNDD